MLITKLLTRLVERTTLYTFESAATAVQLPASNSVGVSVDMTKSGYKFIGILGVHPDGTGNTNGFLYSFYKESDTSVRLGFRNTTSTARNYTVTVQGLYVKLGGVLTNLRNAVFPKGVTA